MLKRIDVYALIDGERAYQDQKFPVAEDGTSASPEGFLHVVESLVNDAKAKYVTEPTPKDREAVMDMMRKIGATAVRAMEQYGAPGRSVADKAAKK